MPFDVLIVGQGLCVRFFVLERFNNISSSWSRTLDKRPQYSQTEPTELLVSISPYLSAPFWFLYPLF